MIDPAPGIPRGSPNEANVRLGNFPNEANVRLGNLPNKANVWVIPRTKPIQLPMPSRTNQLLVPKSHPPAVRVPGEPRQGVLAWGTQSKRSQWRGRRPGEE